MTEIATESTSARAEMEMKLPVPLKTAERVSIPVELQIVIKDNALKCKKNMHIKGSGDYEPFRSVRTLKGNVR